MMRKMCKSKIHTAIITDKNLFYQGSLGLGEDLLKAADIMEGEMILVLNLNNGNRFETYAIAESPGKIVLNGAAARLGEIGDEVIILSWCYLNDLEVQDYNMKNILLDGNNRIKKYITSE